MIDILIIFMSVIVCIRWISLGWTITKHGEQREDKYNAFSHLIGTLVWCWMLYTIYNI